MKIWISVSREADYVYLYTSNPNELCVGLYGLPTAAFVCREDMRRLLRGSGKKLPEHGSEQITEINLTAK